MFGRQSSPLLALLAITTLLTAAAALRADTAVVTTTDGRRFEGELVSQDTERVVLEISGINTPIQREDIDTLEIKPSIEEEYRQRRAELEDDDVEGRYALAYFLFQNDAFDLAEQELADLRQRFPDNERVRLLATVVEQRRRLMAEEPAAPREPRAPRQTPRGEAEGEDAGLDAARLDEEQINRIRVWELSDDFVRTGPPIQVPRDVLTEFLEKYRGEPGVPTGRDDERAFYAASGAEQLEVMMGVRAREYYGQVDVTNDPAALRDFRTRIHRNYVLNYCATSQCHGGGDAPGGLYLFQTQPNSDATVYTNFYILNQYVSSRGQMINRDQPTRSLLLQYGLNRQAAAVPHPDVPGWRQQFTSQDDPRFEQYAQIIDALYSNPDYGVSYSPPGGGAQPAAAPQPEPDQAQPEAEPQPAQP